MRRFLVDVLPEGADVVVLPPSSAHHLAHVLRLTPGTEIVLFDGQRASVVATVTAVGDIVTARTTGAPHREPTATATVLLLAVLKGPAMDTAVRMATEAGATAIWPIDASRSVAKGDRGDRWRRVAAGAARQSRRITVPEIPPPQSLRAALSDLPADLQLYLAHPDPSDTTVTPSAAGILVGPEGGWTEQERALCTGHGALPVHLGPHVLRADTAAAVAVARLMLGRSRP